MWVNQVLGVEARFVLYTSTVYGSPKNKTQSDKKASKIIVSPFGHRLLCRVYLV